MSFINNDENFLQYLYFVCMKHTLADCRHFTFSAMCSTILQQQICLVVCFVLLIPVAEPLFRVTALVCETLVLICNSHFLFSL